MINDSDISELERSLVCSMCGKTLLLDEDVYYIARVQVFAAANAMEISADDLRRDWRRELERLAQEAAKMSAEELESQVYKELTFYLCPPCRAEYLKNPLPTRSTNSGSTLSTGEGPNRGTACI